VNGKGGDLLIFLNMGTDLFNKNCLFDIIVAAVIVEISLFDQVVR
jgi:hypothetical protein